MKMIVGWLIFMFPFTLAFGIIGCLFLNSYSGNFKTLLNALATMVIHGYLRPNELRIEVQKSPDRTFLDFYQVGYTFAGI